MALTETLGSVVPVDSNGYLPPIWLSKEHLYKAVVQKRMAKYPEEQWVDQWYINDVGEVLDSKELPWSDVFYVEDIEALRALNPGKDTEEGSTIYVMGVHEGGDAGYPLMFRWDANSEENGLGLAFVEPSNWGKKGRWVQIFSEAEIDVRKFGAIPGRGEPILTNITAALRYASNGRYNADGKSVVFPSGSYLIEGSLNLESFAANVKILQNARFENISSELLEVIIGQRTVIESDDSIVGKDIGLFFGSIDYVRPQWFHAEFFGDQLALACNERHNPSLALVRVFGMIHTKMSVPTKALDAPVSWESERKLIPYPTQSGGTLTFNERFQCVRSHDVFGDFGNLEVKFKNNPNVYADWFGDDLEKARKSVVHTEQVLRVPSMTVAEPGNNTSDIKVMYEGDITIPNGITYYAGYIVNEVTRYGDSFRFKIEPYASASKPAGKVIANNPVVHYDWFSNAMESSVFRSIVESCEHKVLDLDMRNVSVATSGAFDIQEVKIRNGSIAFGGLVEFGEVSFEDCRIGSRNFKAGEISFNGCRIGSEGLSIRVADYVNVHGSKFDDQDESSIGSALSIHAPSSCVGMITCNIFGETSAKAINYDCTDERFSGTSKIKVVSNSFKNGNHAVTSEVSDFQEGIKYTTVQGRYFPTQDPSVQAYIYYAELVFDRPAYAKAFDSRSVAVEVSINSIARAGFDVDCTASSEILDMEKESINVFLYNYDDRIFDTEFLKNHDKCIELPNHAPTNLQNGDHLAVRYTIKYMTEDL